jgi:hypothetical protein
VVRNPKRVRPEIVAIYFQAITECLKDIAEVEARTVREYALMTASRAESLKKKEIERLRGFLDAFENQIAVLYALPPYSTDEIQALAEKILPDKEARERLMAKVVIKIADHEARKP